MSNHPITPPPELVQEWWESTIPNQSTSVKAQLCTKAAQWGADQELEACVNWLADPCAADMPSLASDLRYSRRPEPPTLKEQALEAWEIANQSWTTISDKEVAIIIRRALEALDD
jgi:hypothetical protein